MRYLEESGDRLTLRESARDHVVRGGLWLFVFPWVVAIIGWGSFALVVDEPSPLALGLAASVVGLGCVIPALAGLFWMGTASKRAERSATHIDTDERLITAPGRAPDVFRKPDAVVVERAGLRGWRLRLEGDRGLTLLRRVPHGGGRDLAAAADALADALGVEASVPRAARRAVGVVPHDEHVWAALCYAPLDGVNVAYSMLALISSRDPALRFAAKQSLAFLAVELFLGLMVSGCVGIPILVASAPFAIEALAFLCPFLFLGLLRVSARLVACVRAYRGEPWVMPWLAPLSRRWAPPRAGERGSSA